MPTWKRSRRPTRSDNLLEEEFAPHFQAWKEAPTPQNTTNLLTAIRPILSEAERSYGAGAVGSPVFASRAKIMALDAMKSYDPSRANLRTHLLAQLQGLHRYAARSESPVRIPEGTALDLNRLRLARERLRDDLNREPSDVELADETGLSLKRLGRLRQLPGPAVVEGQVSKQDQMGAGMWLPPVKSSPVANDLMDSWRSVVYHDSEPSDQVIMQHTFGMFGHPVLSNLQIAKKVKLSPGAVSQRRLKIQKKLDLAEDLGLFGHM